MAEKTKARKIPTPDGYESVEAFLEEARQRRQQAFDADRENREAGLDDLAFLAGEGQWDEQVKAQRLRLGRPCMVINRLPQFVGQVAGDLRINQPAIRVRPAETADKPLADVREGLIRAIEYQSDARGVYINAGEDQVGCGIGNFRVELAYAGADAFDQDILIRHIPNPFAVLWDHMSVERTGADARYVFVDDDIPRKTFERLYPDHPIPDGELGGECARQGWVDTDIVRVSEYWVIKETPRTIALLTDGKIQDITGKEDEYEARIALDSRGNKRVRKANRRSACMYLITGHALLEPAYELPLSRVPIIKVEGRVIRFGSKRVRFGLVRFAKDPQRLKNIWRSVAAEILAMQPRFHWLVHESEEGNADAFRDAISNGDTVLPWTGQQKPERVEPPQSPLAILQQAELADQDIKDTTGLHDAALGARSNETSGKAILARQREGDVATFMYHDNLHASIGACGRVVNELIPVAFDTVRTIRTIGVDETAKVHRINDPADPDSIDLGAGKYDIVVETGPSYSTKRVEAAESMMAFMQGMPQVAAAAADLLAEAQDWPGADKIASRLRRGVPPQLLSPEEIAEQQQAGAAQPGAAPGAPGPGGPAAPGAPGAPAGGPPPQVQAAQAAALQMQMEGAQADLKEKQEKARRAEAEAVRAEALARQAQAEAAQVDGSLQQLIQAGVAAVISGQGGSPPPGAPAIGEGFPGA